RIGGQNSSQLGDRDLDRLTAPYLANRDEPQSVAGPLLVDLQPREDRVAQVGAKLGGQAGAGERGGDLTLERGAAQAERGRDPARRDEPEADRLAVQHAGRRLDGMADGVAEVEQRAVAGLLALVAADDRGLVGDRARDCLAERRRWHRVAGGPRGAGLDRAP